MKRWSWLFTHLKVVLDELGDIVRQSLPRNPVVCLSVIFRRDLFVVFSSRPERRESR